MLDYIHIIFEFISFLISIIFYRFIKDSYMKWFVPFLGFIFIAELINNRFYYLHSLTILIHYIIGIAESVFYGYIFYKLSNRPTQKKGIIIFIILSVIGYVSSYFTHNTSITYFLFNLIISGFLLATIALVYLYTKFVDDDNTLLISESGFWIAFGVSLFYSGISISFSLYDLIYKNNLSLFGQNLLNLVPRILSVFLYISISISIVLCRKKKQIL